MKRQAAFALLLVATGCLDVADGPAPMCESTADCDGGETCDEGICFGNPPAGPFAALITPPSERTDLTTAEVLDLRIGDDGTLPTMTLEEPVIYRGSLVGCQAPLMCDSLSLAATVTVSRRASFLGGPSFRSIFESTAEDGFQIKVPRTRNGETYTVTVMPAGRDGAPGSMTTAAQVVPPLRLQLALPASETNRVIELGGAAANHLVQGMIVTSTGTPVSQYRVVALGHWEEDAPLTEVSTIDYTGSDGTFSVRLSADLVGEARVVATPFNSALRPTLTRTGVSTEQDSLDTVLTLPEGLGSSREVELPITGVDGNGEVKPVPGARVIVRGSVTQDRTTASIVVEGTTDVAGTAKRLGLLDGADIARSYRLTVVPPANATIGVVLDEPFTLNDRLATLQLRDRIAIRGVLRDFDGSPIKDAAVTVRPSLRFLWSLPETLQDLLTTIPAATTVTPESGEFVVWVDRALGDVWGQYDLVFETSSLLLPNVTRAEIALPRDEEADQVILQDIFLPDAAYVRGTVVDAQGATIEGAEIKIYRMPPQQIALCAEVEYAPVSCPIPATLLGRGAADADGRVRVTLPRP